MRLMIATGEMVDDVDEGVYISPFIVMEIRHGKVRMKDGEGCYGFPTFINNEVTVMRNKVAEDESEDEKSVLIVWINERKERK